MNCIKKVSAKGIDNFGECYFLAIARCITLCPGGKGEEVSVSWPNFRIFERQKYSEKALQPSLGDFSGHMAVPLLLWPIHYELSTSLRVEKKDSRLIVAYVSRHCFLQLTDCLFACKTQTSDFDRGMLVDICNCVWNQIKLCKVFIMAVRITVGTLLSKRMGDPLMSLIYGKQHYVFTRLDLLNTEIFHSSLSIVFCDKCSR